MREEFAKLKVGALLFIPSISPYLGGPCILEKYPCDDGDDDDNNWALVRRPDIGCNGSLEEVELLSLRVVDEEFYKQALEVYKQTWDEFSKKPVSEDNIFGNMLRRANLKLERAYNERDKG